MPASVRIFHAEEAPAPIYGHARLPKWIIALPTSSLTTTAKTVLAAILGCCFGDSRSCDPTVDDLVEKSGCPKRSVERALRELLTYPLIRRETEPGRAGSPRKTTILFDPTSAKPIAPSGPQLPANLAVFTATVADNPATVADNPSFKFEQKFLRFTTTTTETPSQVDPLIERAVELFPLLSIDPTPILGLLELHGPELVECSLDLAAAKRKNSGGKTPTQIRWIAVTLENWQSDIAKRLATPRSIRAQVPRPPSSAPPLARSAPSSAQLALPAGSFTAAWAAMQRGDESAAERILTCPAEPEKETGCGTSAKTPPQPAGDPSRTEPNYTAGKTPRQNEPSESPDQRARLDSNQQPSDSKSAYSRIRTCLCNNQPRSPERTARPAPSTPVVKTIRGSIVREPLTPTPNGRQPSITSQIQGGHDDASDFD
jgi:hypothetical protein